MVVEVLNTGTELLLGHTVNTHAAFFGQELFNLGLRVSRQTTVPDGEAIRSALEEALRRADVVLVTGGLGPTTDDLTREITADLLQLPLEENAEVLEAIVARFAKRGLVMRERNRRQAMVPRGAVVLENPHGTAPGLYLRYGWDDQTAHVFLLPGPPRELHPMFHDHVMPRLTALVGDVARPEKAVFRITGLGESEVEGRVGERLLEIAGLELGYCARAGEVEVRLIGPREAVERGTAIVRETLGDRITSEDNRPLEHVVVEAFQARGWTLALAESCTGGFLAHRITNVPGASKVLLAGYVTYSNAAKAAALGVPETLIAEHGAVSMQVAEAMAQGALNATGASVAISVTGIAGPGGGSRDKPVGTVFVGAVHSGRIPCSHRYHFPTDRETFKSLVAATALDHLRKMVAVRL